MAVQHPAIEWPNFLEGCWPEQDPDIVLKGTAHISATLLEVVAIRIDPQLRCTPDYKPDVPEARLPHRRLRDDARRIGIRHRGALRGDRRGRTEYRLPAGR